MGYSTNLEGEVHEAARGAGPKERAAVLRKAPGYAASHTARHITLRILREWWMKKRKGTLALHISIVVFAGSPKRTCSHCQQSGQTVGTKAFARLVSAEHSR